MATTRQQPTQTNLVTWIIDFILDLASGAGSKASITKHCHFVKKIETKRKPTVVSSDVSIYLHNKRRELIKANEALKKQCEPLLTQYKVNRLEIDRITKILNSL